MVITQSESGGKSSAKLSNVLSQYCYVKLDMNNYLLWQNMVLLVIRGNKLEGFINGAKPCPPEFLSVTVPGSTEIETKPAKPKPKPNPDFEEWFARDQLLCTGSTTL
ncbi:hypothetical protein LWI28_022623 [Acer negundo]|uniref:Retrotransposon Copia-like N-terminal domain-containing protein n=1 Tax=Acer negundo TaxID=4023 RepID=A0AAD5NNW4_ACENE|nr:hypothetical protein LWI28_022623 [Acer negundo]